MRRAVNVVLSDSSDDESAPGPYDHLVKGDWSALDLNQFESIAFSELSHTLYDDENESVFLDSIACLGSSPSVNRVEGAAGGNNSGSAGAKVRAIRHVNGLRRVELAAPVCVATATAASTARVMSDLDSMNTTDSEKSESARPLGRKRLGHTTSQSWLRDLYATERAGQQSLAAAGRTHSNRSSREDSTTSGSDRSRASSSGSNRNHLRSNSAECTSRQSTGRERVGSFCCGVRTRAEVADHHHQDVVSSDRFSVFSPCTPTDAVAILANKAGNCALEHADVLQAGQSGTMTCADEVCAAVVPDESGELTALRNAAAQKDAALTETAVAATATAPTARRVSMHTQGLPTSKREISVTMLCSSDATCRAPDSADTDPRYRGRSEQDDGSSHEHPIAAPQAPASSLPVQEQHQQQQQHQQHQQQQQDEGRQQQQRHTVQGRDAVMAAGEEGRPTAQQSVTHAASATTAQGQTTHTPDRTETMSRAGTRRANTVLPPFPPGPLKLLPTLPLSCKSVALAPQHRIQEQEQQQREEVADEHASHLCMHITDNTNSNMSNDNTMSAVALTSSALLQSRVLLSSAHPPALHGRAPERYQYVKVTSYRTVAASIHATCRTEHKQKLENMCDDAVARPSAQLDTTSASTTALTLTPTENAFSSTTTTGSDLVRTPNENDTRSANRARRRRCADSGRSSGRRALNILAIAEDDAGDSNTCSGDTNESHKKDSHHHHDDSHKGNNEQDSVHKKSSSLRVPNTSATRILRSGADTETGMPDSSSVSTASKHKHAQDVTSTLGIEKDTNYMRDVIQDARQQHTEHLSHDTTPVRGACAPGESGQIGTAHTHATRNSPYTIMDSLRALVTRTGGDVDVLAALYATLRTRARGNACTRQTQQACAALLQSLTVTHASAAANRTDAICPTCYDNNRRNNNDAGHKADMSRSSSRHDDSNTLPSPVGALGATADVRDEATRYTTLSMAGSANQCVITDNYHTRNRKDTDVYAMDEMYRYDAMRAWPETETSSDDEFDARCVDWSKPVRRGSCSGYRFAEPAIRVDACDATAKMGFGEANALYRLRDRDTGDYYVFNDTLCYDAVVEVVYAQDSNDRGSSNCNNHNGSDKSTNNKMSPAGVHGIVTRGTNAHSPTCTAVDTDATRRNENTGTDRETHKEDGCDDGAPDKVYSNAHSCNGDRMQILTVHPEETVWLCHCHTTPLPTLHLRRLIALADTAPVPHSVAQCAARVTAEVARVRESLPVWQRASEQSAFLTHCLRAQLPFTDLSFAPCAGSLSRRRCDVVCLPALPWRRPGDYLSLCPNSERTALAAANTTAHATDNPASGANAAPNATDVASVVTAACAVVPTATKTACARPAITTVANAVHTCSTATATAATCTANAAAPAEARLFAPGATHRTVVVTPMGKHSGAHTLPNHGFVAAMAALGSSSSNSYSYSSPSQQQQQSSPSSSSLPSSLSSAVMCRWLFRHPRGARAGRRERQMGCYRVCVHHNGWWSHVVLDDYLPASRHGPLFAHDATDSRVLWVSMLEKAWAKSAGSYAALCEEDALTALGELTGLPVWGWGGRLWSRAKAAAQQRAFRQSRTDRGRCGDDSPRQTGHAENNIHGNATGKAMNIDGCTTNSADSRDADKDDDEDDVRLFELVSRHVREGCTVMAYTPAGSDVRWQTPRKHSSSSTAAHVPPAEEHCNSVANACAMRLRPGHVYLIRGLLYDRANDLRMLRITDLLFTEADNPTMSTVTKGKDSDHADDRICATTMRKDSSNDREEDGLRTCGDLLPSSHTPCTECSHTRTHSCSTNKHTAASDADLMQAQPTLQTGWVEWNDALSLFSGVGVCFTLWDWHRHYVRGRFEQSHPHVVLALYVHGEDAEVMVSVARHRWCDVRDADGNVTRVRPIRYKRGIGLALLQASPSEDTCGGAAEDANHGNGHHARATRFAAAAAATTKTHHTIDPSTPLQGKVCTVASAALPTPIPPRPTIQSRLTTLPQAAATQPIAPALASAPVLWASENIEQAGATPHYVCEGAATVRCRLRARAEPYYFVPALEPEPPRRPSCGTLPHDNEEPWVSAARSFGQMPTMNANKHVTSPNVRHGKAASSAVRPTQRGQGDMQDHRISSASPPHVAGEDTHNRHSGSVTTTTDCAVSDAAATVAAVLAKRRKEESSPVASLRNRSIRDAQYCRSTVRLCSGAAATTSSSSASAVANTESDAAYVMSIVTSRSLTPGALEVHFRYLKPGGSWMRCAMTPASATSTTCTTSATSANTNARAARMRLTGACEATPVETEYQWCDAGGVHCAEGCSLQTDGKGNGRD